MLDDGCLVGAVGPNPERASDKKESSVMNVLRMGQVAACLLLPLLLWAGCSDDHDHGASSSGAHASAYPTCDAIIKQCHPLDLGVGKISECHVLAHESTNDAECAAKKDECLAACVASDAGDGNSSDATTD